MSTDRHIDRICITIISLTLVLTILFMHGSLLGIVPAERTVKYESTLFDTSYVHEIDIVMDDWDSFIETCENEEYSVCTVVIDGVKYSNTAIRAKGNTSLSTVRTMGSSRYSFKLEFDHYVDGKTMDGLDKLCLNNLIQDNTMMKDYIVYTLMDSFGADAPLCSFAYITVNGEDWGLYLAVEGIEESFLERNYGTDHGELYKPDSMSFGGGRGNGRDFDINDLDLDTDLLSGMQLPEDTDPSADSGFSGGPAGGDLPSGNMPQGGFSAEDIFGDGGFSFGDGGFSFGDGNFSFGGGGFSFSGMGSDDVKLRYIDDDPSSYSNIFDNAKTDITNADKERLISALKSLSQYEDLEYCLDMEEVLRYFAVHNFVVNSDSYTGSMVHNYYLYEEDGQLSMIPWDYNLAFGTFSGNDASGSVNGSIDGLLSGGDPDERPMLGWIFSDEIYTEMYYVLFTEFLDEWFSDGELETLIRETSEMIAPYVKKDPTAFCSYDEFTEGVDALTEFVTLRAEAVSGQLEGRSDRVDTSGLDLSAMGTMGGGGGMSVPGGMSFTGRPDSGRPDDDGSGGETGSGGEDHIPKDEDESAGGNSFPGGQGGRPDTGGFSSDFGSMPDGSGSFPGGQEGMPDTGGFSGGFGSRPEGDSFSGNSTEQPQNVPSGDDGTGSGGRDDAQSGSSAGMYRQQSSDRDALKLLAVSFAVLAAGIFIAVKKKY